MPPTYPASLPATARHGPDSQVSACTSPCSKVCKNSPQGGAGLIEFTIVAVPILLLSLGSIEVAHWLLARQVVSLALLEAGRAGISAQAHPASIATAFEQALLPLFPATDNSSARQNQQLAFQQRSHDTASAAWQIVILSPSFAAFNDFADARLNHSSPGGLPTINNNYQFEQDQRRRAQGWANGLGPESKASIYQANTLILRLSYLHKPVLPGIKGLLRLLGKPQGSYSQHAMAHGYLPLNREISLSMQSHPVRWPMPEGGNIIWSGAPAHTSRPASFTEPCTGLWCIDQRLAGGGLERQHPAGNMPAHGTTRRHENAVTPAEPQPVVPANPDTAELAITPDDPACGLTLCCAPA